MYIFVTFFMVPKMRKLLKIMLYVLVFIGLLFPVFEGIGNLKINLETYAIILAGIEAFEMIFKYIIEDTPLYNFFIKKYRTGLSDV